MAPRGPIPNYNIMGPAKASLEANVRFMAADLGKHGIRVNGISAGPIKTLAAMGIGGFRGMMSQFEKVAPLRRAVTIEEVGNVVAFLSSDLASALPVKSSMSMPATIFLASASRKDH